MSDTIGWLSEKDSIMSYMPPALLEHAGYALNGKAMNVEGETPGVAVTAANLQDSLRSMIDGTAGWDPNPYSVAYSYPGLEAELNEEDELVVTQDMLTEFQLALNGLTEWYTVDNMEELFPASTTFTPITAPDILDDAADEAVLEYQSRAAATHDAEIARYKAAMFAQDGHLTSAFYLGLAVLHAAKAQDVNTFRGRLFIDQAGRRAAIELEAAKADLVRQQAERDTNFRDKQQRLAVFSQATDFQRAVYFAHFESMRTRYDMDVQYNQAAVSWAFQNVLRYATLVVPLSGTPLSDPPPTKLERGIATALSVGSNMGMQLGDKFGPAAGVAGALFGGAAGFATQLLR